RFRMHIFIDAACAGDARPPRSKSLAGLDEFALEDEDELRPLVPMNRKPRPGLESHDLHLPAVCRGDILHEHAGCECGWPPGKVVGVDAHRSPAFEHVHSSALRDTPLSESPPPARTGAESAARRSASPAPSTRAAAARSSRSSCSAPR